MNLKIALLVIIRIIQCTDALPSKPLKHESDATSESKVPANFIRESFHLEQTHRRLNSYGNENSNESNYDELYSDEDMEDEPTPTAVSQPVNTSDNTSVVRSVSMPHGNLSDLDTTSGNGDDKTELILWIVLSVLLAVILLMSLIIIRMHFRCEKVDNESKDNTYLRYMDSFASFDKTSFEQINSEPSSPIDECILSLDNKAKAFPIISSTSNSHLNENNEIESNERNVPKRLKPKKQLSFRDNVPPPEIKEKVFQISFRNSKSLKIKINTSVVLENTSL